MPRTIGAVLSARMASLVEMQSVLGLQDVYDLLEVIAVDAHNRQLAAKKK